VHLFNRVKHEFTGSSGNYMVEEVLCPGNAREAVLAGALEWGLDMKVVTRRVVPRSYGQEIFERWDASKAKPEYTKVPNPITGVDSYMRMQWFIDADTEITDSQPVPTFFRTNVPSSSSPILQIKLLAWDTKPGHNKGPDIKDGDCYFVGTLEFKLDSVDWSKQQRKEAPNGDCCYTLRWKMELLFSDNLTFRATLLPDGPVVELTVKYD